MFRVFPCERQCSRTKLYCRGHQGKPETCEHSKVPDFYTVHDLNRDLNKWDDFVNFTNLPFKVGIWLKENEIRKAVFEKIEKVKVKPLKAMCKRLGLRPKDNWRKVEHQEALLTVVGHPLFEAALNSCLWEDGQIQSRTGTLDPNLDVDHAVNNRLDRQFGVNRMMWAQLQAAEEFEEFQ